MENSLQHDQEDALTDNAEQIADDDDREEGDDEEENEEENEREIERQGQQVLEFAKARFRQLIKGTLEHHAAERRKKKRKKRGTGGAAAIHTFADVAELSMEEQVRMQIACLTQSHFDCATRAAGEQPPDDADDDGDDRHARRIAPPDAQRSYRTIELRSQTHLAVATARLVETVQRGQGTQMRHAFTYEHLHRHAPPAPTPSEEDLTTPEQVAARVDSITEQVFEDIVLTRATDNPPPPPSSV